MKIRLTLALAIAFYVSYAQKIEGLKISEGKNHLITKSGKPFFWMGDTGWLLFSKLNMEETKSYLNDRQKKGFNVIQVMVLHTLEMKDTDGSFALRNGDLAKPDTINGYWRHVDAVIKEAEKRGIYLALVPVWGSVIKNNNISQNQAEHYAKFLAIRYGNKKNIVWLNGGDIKGNIKPEVWETIGKILKKNIENQLITFHPYGRHSSVDWFHDASWLDFNMFQSGHKSYSQDTLSTDLHHFGEDNWKFVNEALTKTPLKPVLDGEPSYEGIPHGLHDFSQPFWTAADARRYAWWAVCEGAIGHTYGHSAIMQFYKNMEVEEKAYGVKETWIEALNAPGAAQMQYLKILLENIPDYQNRKPASEKVKNQGDKYERIAAFETGQYFVAYTFSGKKIELRESYNLKNVRKGYWYNPENGQKSYFKITENIFLPPERASGKDWVLVLEQL